MKYTLAVTSCNRFELLKRTLESFAVNADVFPESTIIVEDSDAPKPEWVSQLHGRAFGQITWVSNGKRRGQIFTLDRLYDLVQTEHAFHLEDDWLFESSGFIQDSFAIMNAFRDIWTVSLRGNDCNGHPVVTDERGIPLNQPGWNGGWGGCHFNPGLRRMSDYRRIGSYGRRVGYGKPGCGFELGLSRLHLELGYRIAVLPKMISHLGHGVSRAVEPLPSAPRVLIAVPVAQKYEYGGHTLPVKRITDGRVDAVRNTWWKDIAKFPNVDGRFFYGQPVRNWAEDEVFLNCPDDYESLAAKVREVCRYALHHGYDYLVKTDDDTVLFLDRLLRSGFESAHQMGFFRCGDHQHGRICKCYVTGMCYTLDRRAMEAVVNAPLTHWAEDLSVGNALREAGLRPTGHPGWVPGFADHYVKFPLPAGTVAAHSVTPADMLGWYEKLMNCTPEGDRKEAPPCVTYQELPSALL